MTTAITLREYRQRRAELMRLMAPGSVALVPAAGIRLRNRDTEYLFRQDSDFFYLTGFNEPDALLVLAPGRVHGEVVLFCRERDARGELYDGERCGPERAVERLKVDDAFPVGDLEDILPGMLEGRERIYMTLGEYPELDNKVLHWVNSIRAREAGGARSPGEFVALKHLLHEQRLIKSPAELRIMREAAAITVAAHCRAMRACQPGMTELALEAELLHEFMIRGARTPAYSSIVAGGPNACVMHYVDNGAPLADGELVLIDAGCEYAHYAADVTRTFPINGRFSPAQRALYDIVLEANLRAIASCRPGAHFMQPHQTALEVMVDGLIDLGLLAGDRDELIASGAHRRFCPHNSSHWLGSDVHDVGDYRVAGAWRDLEAGMVLTIEPGIYVQPTDRQVPEQWRGIGIRVEDDVVITRSGHEVLTEAAPKTVDDITRLMGGRRKRSRSSGHAATALS
ncbi:MAG: Xaa-Pro aminopeptidase [Pseudomonadales bacterium]|jgi:Xaa-Pro aminopeptidase